MTGPVHGMVSLVSQLVADVVPGIGIGKTGDVAVRRVWNDKEKIIL